MDPCHRHLHRPRPFIPQPQGENTPRKCGKKGGTQGKPVQGEKAVQLDRLHRRRCDVIPAFARPGLVGGRREARQETNGGDERLNVQSAAQSASFQEERVNSCSLVVGFTAVPSGYSGRSGMNTTSEAVMTGTSSLFGSHPTTSAASRRRSLLGWREQNQRIIDDCCTCTGTDLGIMLLASSASAGHRFAIWAVSN